MMLDAESLQYVFEALAPLAIEIADAQGDEAAFRDALRRFGEVFARLPEEVREALSSLLELPPEAQEAVGAALLAPRGDEGQPERR